MGLDMYLYAEQYVSGWDYQRERDKYGEATTKELKTFDTMLKLLGLEHSSLPTCNSLIVDVQVGYWRIANVIYNWFVDNVPGGVADGRRRYVARSKIQELADLCDKILEGIDFGEPSVEDAGFPWALTTYPNLTFSDEARDLINDKLPPQDGPLFGGSGVDEWYALSIKETAEILHKILDNPKLLTFDFYYRFSW